MGWVSSAKVSRKAAKLQIAGQGISPFSSGGGALATAVRMQGRILLDLGPWAVTDLRVPVVGFYVPGAITKTNLPKAYTCNFAIEVISGFATTSVDVLWSGVAQKVITPGDALSYSDNWCAVNGNLPAGSKVFLRYDITVPTAGMLSHFEIRASNSGPYLSLGYWYTTTGAATNSVNGVGPFVGTGSGGNQTRAPICIHGVLAKYDFAKTGALVLGDSKTIGTGLTDNLSGKSAVSRALYDMNIPMINYGFAGTNLSQWAALNASVYAHAEFCSDVFIGFPINDITAGRTLVQLQTDMTNLITTLKSVNSSINVWVCKTEPHTDSTDAWVTTVNQTPTVGCEAVGSVRTNYNAWLDTLVGSTIKGTLDPNVVCESGGSGTSALWVSTSTTDGLHPADTMINSISLEYKKQFLAKGGIPNTGAF